MNLEHPPAERLEQFLAGNVGDEDTPRIANHVDTCPVCQAEVEWLDRQRRYAVRQLAQRLRPAEAGDERFQGFLRRVELEGLAATPPGGQQDWRPDTLRFPLPATPLGPLGQVESFHVQKFLGDGEFGSVFKAYDETERRTVAIKIMKGPYAVDPKHRARFRREARAVANIRHEHTVAVYDAREPADFAPYLVLEFVNGESLSERLRRGEVSPQEAADLIWQATLGVAAVHANGFVHRDIKPANILLDQQTGRVKVRDFGVVRSLEPLTEKLTESGALVGTPHYMSPEQVATPAKVDPRSDVFSLGVVLYRLLAGERPFRGDTTKTVYDNISGYDPPPPSRFKKGISSALDTITMRCLVKNPRRRYSSAALLAEDLQRWGKGEQIWARPVSRAERFLDACERNPLRVALAAVSTALALVVLLAGLWTWRTKAETARQVKENLNEANLLLERENLPAALVAARQADRLLDGTSLGELRRHTDELLADLNILDRLETIRFEQANWRGGQFDMASADAGYAAAFRDYGIDVETLAPADAAARVHVRAIEAKLVAALCDWFMVSRDADRRKYLAVVLASVDPDDWRSEVRGAVVSNNSQALNRLAEATNLAGQPAYALELLGAALGQSGEAAQAATLLGRAQLHYPRDIGIVLQLARQLEKKSPPDLEQALGYYRVACALRPKNPGLLQNLGAALIDKGDHDAGLVVTEEALRFDPHNADAHRNRGLVYSKKGDLVSAVQALNEAIRLNPKMATAHHDLGLALAGRGDLKQAVLSFREAVKLQSDDPNYRYNLKTALYKRADELRRQGLRGEAIGVCQAALDVDSNYLEAHYTLGLLYRDEGRFNEAVAGLQKSRDLLKPDDPLRVQCEKWIDYCQQAIKLEARLATLLSGSAPPASAAECLSLAQLCARKKLHSAAVRFYERAFADDPQLAHESHAGHRYNAACVAALAAAGKGEDAGKLADKERTRLRKQALEWLRADLILGEKQFDSGQPANRAAVQQTMLHWQQDPDLAGIRDAAALAVLPEEEQKTITQLWTDVAALLKSAEEKPN